MFRRISVDGFDIPKTKQGLHLYKTRMNCNAIGRTPCSTNPCGNEGTCIPSGSISFRFIFHMIYFFVGGFIGTFYFKYEIQTRLMDTLWDFN